MLSHCTRKNKNKIFSTINYINFFYLCHKICFYFGVKYEVVYVVFFNVRHEKCFFVNASDKICFYFGYST